MHAIGCIDINWLKFQCHYEKERSKCEVYTHYFNLFKQLSSIAEESVGKKYVSLVLSTDLEEWLQKRIQKPQVGQNRLAKL